MNTGPEGASTIWFIELNRNPLIIVFVSSNSDAGAGGGEGREGGLAERGGRGEEQLSLTPLRVGNNSQERPVNSGYGLEAGSTPWFIELNRNYLVH